MLWPFGLKSISVMTGQSLDYSFRNNNVLILSNTIIMTTDSKIYKQLRYGLSFQHYHKYNSNYNIFSYMNSFTAVSLALLLVSTFNFQVDMNQNDLPIEQKIKSKEYLKEDLQCGYTDHFITFLYKNNYTNYRFDRPDVRCGALGGKQNSQDIITKIPIIFIHGTCDVGYGRGSIDGYENWQTGFRSLVRYFTQQLGYSRSELYITTWGPANNLQIQSVYQSKAHVQYIRAFIQAVIAYTGAPQVNIISHSMGVAIARKAIKGGSATDHSYGNYDVGYSLKDKVKTFIGIAGVNLGLMQCIPNVAFNYCNKVDGLFPGATAISSPSTFLANLNSMGGTEGQNVYTVWSKYDQLILNQCIVWGKITCRIPGQTAEIQKLTSDWGHFDLRDRIGPDIINWL